MPAMPALLVPAELLAQWAGSVSLAWLMRVWQILLKGLDDMKTAPRARDVLEMTLALCVLVREGQGAASGAVVASPAPAAPPSVPPAEAAVQTTGDLPPSFAAMVRLFEENREMVLAMHLRQSVELVAYEPGSVTLFLKAEAPQDLVVRAARLLQIWTGYAWSLTPSRTRGQSSLLEQQQHTTAHARQDALAQPLPQAIANAFPEAQPLWEDMR
jgi:DNA polymerase-3 subunit gamma/tau